MSSVSVAEDGRELVVETDAVTVFVHLNQGTFDLASSSGIGFRGAAASVEVQELGWLTSRGIGFDVEDSSDFRDSRGNGVCVRLIRKREEDEPEMTLSCWVYERLPYVLLRLEVRNYGRGELRIGAMRPLAGGRLELPSRPETWRFYKNGWQSWSPTLVVPCDGEDVQVAPPVAAPGTSPEPAAGRFVSDLVTAVIAPEGQGLTAGFVTSADQFSHVWLDRDGAQITAASYADGVKVEPGGAIASELLYVEATGSPVASLGSFGDVLAAEMEAIPYDEVASGWCSWYQYWHGVTGEDIVSNLDRLTAEREGLPVRYVQIDDGYQAEIGDWLDVNEKFPSGMRPLVDRIHDGGFEAGLWLAPFLVGANSQLYKDHPDWVVQFKTGRPYVATINWGQPCYALDLSRDDVIEWLREVFTTVVDEWGFDYVKIDFIYGGAVDGIRANSDYTRAQVYRRGLQAIRDAVGERFILGCGNPLGPSVGLINGSRVGPDVAPFWAPKPFEPMPQRNPMSEPSALNSIRNTITRFWMHDRLWMNDPDCLLVRDSDTALSEDEVRTMTTVIAMTGGMVLDSDDLGRLTPERREMISMLLPVYGKTAVPLDLFTSDMPQVLELDCGSHRMLALFNWSGEPVQVSAPIGEKPAVVFDAWEREYLGEATGEMPLEIRAHGCRLVSVRGAQERPQMIGSTFHLLQGACEVAEERWDGEKLTLALKSVAVKDGTIFVRIPNGRRVTIEGADDAVIKITGAGICSIAFELREPRELTIALANG